MIREFGESVGDAIADRAGRAAARVQERRSLPVDLLESDEAYLAVFDAPGATTSDVQVRYAEGRVLVRVDRFREFHDEFTMRFPGRGLSLDGEVELPDDAVVTAEHASATLTDRGTLEVELPKVETAEIATSSGGDTDGDDAGDGDTGAGRDDDRRPEDATDPDDDRRHEDVTSPDGDQKPDDGSDVNAEDD